MTVLRKSVLGRAGMGLMEVLAMSGIGMITAMGALKISQTAVRSADMTKTVLAEQDLSYTINKLLSEPKVCKWNLYTSRIVNGEITSLVKTDKDPGTAKDSSDPVLIKKGLFKQGLLDIKKLELANINTTNKTADFKVYYSKPRLGNFKTLGGEECSSAKPAGCYFFSCKMNYECSSGACSKCDPANCSNREGGGEGSVTWDNVPDCPPNKVLTVSAGRPQCVDFNMGNSCPQGQAFQGVKENTDGTKSPVCLDLSECPEGQVYRGVKTNSEGVLVKVCAPFVKANQTCAPGTYPIGYNATGELVCERVCPGGKTWSGSKCCPVSTPKSDSSNNCIACPTNTVWNRISKTCVSE